MLPTLGATLLWVPALLGLGTLVPTSGHPACRRAVSGLLGLAVMSVAAMVIHLAAPIGPAVATALWLVGIWRFVARRAWLAEGATRGEIVGVLLALPWLLSWRQAPAAHYDAGLYYIQTVRWTTEHPLRLGLANLHGRLGFNSAWHVVSAALELPGLEGRSAAFLNLLPMLFTAALSAVGLSRIGAGRARFADWALGLLLPVTGHAVGGLGASAPDQAVSLLLCASLALWVAALESAGAGFAEEALPALLLWAFAVTVKLSAAPALLLVASALLLRRSALPRGWLAVAAGLCAAIAIPWVVRSMLLSGCAAYPVPWTCQPDLPWAVPAAAVREELDWIRSWPRDPRAPAAVVLADWRWLEEWGQRMAARADLRTLAATSAAGLAAAAAAGRPGVALLLPLAAALAGAAFVFLETPDPRFGFGFLHALWLLPLAHGAARAEWLRSPWSRRLAVVAVIALAARWARLGSVSADRGASWLAFSEPPAVVTEERLTSSGLRVRVPVGTDRCWATPLPCTPSFNPALREAGRMLSVKGEGDTRR